MLIRILLYVLVFRSGLKPDTDGIILLIIRIINVKIGKERPAGTIHTAKGYETPIECLSSGVVTTVPIFVYSPLAEQRCTTSVDQVFPAILLSIAVFSNSFYYGRQMLRMVRTDKILFSIVHSELYPSCPALEVSFHLTVKTYTVATKVLQW